MAHWKTSKNLTCAVFVDSIIDIIDYTVYYPYDLSVQFCI